MYDIAKMSAAYKNGTAPMPLLPIDGFPPALQEIIENCTTTYCIPRDYWAGSILLASALGIGTRLELVNNHRNFPILWLVLIGDVSTGKTVPINFCLDFFKKLDSRSIKKYDEEMAEYSRLFGMSTKERLLEGGTENLLKPTCLQYILNDYTPEALVEAHKNNNRGLLILRDELKGWFDDFGRYNKSGEQSNMVSSWSGTGMTYNRKGSGIMNIEHPCIMVCGGMQPGLLPSLAACQRADDGFLSRLCCVYPDNAKKAAYNTNILPEKYKIYWEEYLMELVSLKNNTELSLSSEAEEKYSRWFNANKDVSNDEDSEYLKGIYGKLDIFSLRLAVVIRGMKMVCNADYSKEISGEDMAQALALTEYFRAAALKVYRKLFVTIPKSMPKKRDVAAYLNRNSNMNVTEISKLLETSRSQINRSCAYESQ